MSIFAKLLAIVAVALGIGLSDAARAADVLKGAWKFGIDRQDQPWLGYYDTSGKTVFLVSCGAHFDIIAVYPAKPKQDGRQGATITIANGKTQMDLVGFSDVGSELTPPHAMMFDQSNLGDPDLAGDKFLAVENRLFDILDSGQPLTFSAEGKSYVLPPVKAPRWRARFQKIC